MITYKTLGQWDADMTFKNEAEYEAFRAYETAHARISTIQNKLTKEYKVLNNPKMAEYVEETKEIIAGLEAELEEWKAKEQEAIKAEEAEKEQPEEYGKC